MTSAETTTGTAEQLRAAIAAGKTAGQEAGPAGVDVTRCPYGEDQPTARDLWLRWAVHEWLNGLGWPETDAE